MGTRKPPSTAPFTNGAKPGCGRVVVVVPAYNAGHCIQRLLCSLEGQVASLDATLVVADNNSKDHTVQFVERFLASSKIRGHLVHGKLQSSYSARNCGIQKVPDAWAYAFIDADCIPEPDWLETGLEALRETNAELLAGKVQFQFPSELGAAHIVDSFTNLNNEEGVNAAGYARTANLFVRKEVFDEIGLFDPQQVSGEDLCWTKRATEAGFKLVYSPETMVYHPARGFWELLKKQYRVGLGKNRVLAAQGFRPQGIFRKTLLSLWIPKWSLVEPRVTCLDEETRQRRRIPILATVWVMRLATAAGQLRSLLGK
jgi:glycosyltransferase involved in cell wall biosynthesis